MARRHLQLHSAPEVRNPSGASFDYNASFTLMASLRGAVGVGEFDRCVELARAHRLVPPAEWPKYLAHPSVDLKDGKVRGMEKVSALGDEGRALCGEVGFTMTLELTRVDADQRAIVRRTNNLKEMTVARLKQLIDEIKGHTPKARAVLPRSTHSAVAVAAGNLFIDETSMADLEDRYDLLHRVFLQHPECRALLPRLEQSYALLAGRKAEAA